MGEALLVYLIVAAAACWTAWTLVLRGWWARRAAAQRVADTASKGCGPDCSCGN